MPVLHESPMTIYMARLIREILPKLREEDSFSDVNKMLRLDAIDTVTATILTSDQGGDREDMLEKAVGGLQALAASAKDRSALVETVSTILLASPKGPVRQRMIDCVLYDVLREDDTLDASAINVILGHYADNLKTDSAAQLKGLFITNMFLEKMRGNLDAASYDLMSLFVTNHYENSRPATYMLPESQTVPEDQKITNRKRSAWAALLEMRDNMLARKLVPSQAFYNRMAVALQRSNQPPPPQQRTELITKRLLPFLHEPFAIAAALQAAVYRTSPLKAYSPDSCNSFVDHDVYASYHVDNRILNLPQASMASPDMIPFHGKVSPFSLLLDSYTRGTPSSYDSAFIEAAAIATKAGFDPLNVVPVRTVDDILPHKAGQAYSALTAYARVRASAPSAYFPYYDYLGLFDLVVACDSSELANRFKHDIERGIHPLGSILAVLNLPDGSPSLHSNVLVNAAPPPSPALRRRLQYDYFRACPVTSIKRELFPAKFTPDADLDVNVLQLAERRLRRHGHQALADELAELAHLVHKSNQSLLAAQELQVLRLLDRNKFKVN